MAADETTRCLWMITHRSIMGITLDNLLQLGKVKNIHTFNWNSLYPFPSDFLHQLPNYVSNFFFYDSNLFLSDGFRLNSNVDNDCDISKFYKVSFQYYSKHNKPIEISEVPFPIPIVPTETDNRSYVLKIRDKFYVFCDCAYWVLDPGVTKDWRSFDIPSRNYINGQIFILRDKLFFQCLSGQGRYFLATLTDRGEWKELDDKIGYVPSLTEVSSLPFVPQHQVVALSWKLCYVGTVDKQQAKVKLCALLLDISNNCVSVSRYQSLFEPLSSTPIILSPTLDAEMIRDEVKFVDLSNGMVCVYVFSLSLLPEVVAAPQEPNNSKTKNQKFLDVDVHVNRAFILPHYSYDYSDDNAGEKEKEKEEEEYNFMLDELDVEAEKKKEEEDAEPMYECDYLNRVFVFPYMEELPHKQ